MAKTPSACGKALLFRHASWLVGVLLVWAVLPLHSKIDFLGRLELPSDDFASTRTSLQPTERIAIIAIDDQRHSPASARLFRGDSMSKLTPKIRNEPMSDVRIIRPEQFEKRVSIVARSIGKQPDADGFEKSSWTVMTGDAPGKSLMDADIKLQASVHP